jgi:D-glycero-D-manno-heptose 1,7-bisphosphate phosphatase
VTAWLDAPLTTLSLHDLDFSRERPPGSSRTSLRPAVFLDKDGTLVVPDDATIHDPSRLRLMPGAGEALARLSAAGLTLVLVTNESGIARGAFTRVQFARLQGALLRRLKDEFGVVLADVAVCPHAPDVQGRPACLCRKPAPGMLTRAARAHGLDLARSWMVGDLLDDVEAGHRAGATGLLLDTGGETVWRRSPLREPAGVFSDWPSLADHLLREAASGSGPMSTPTDDVPGDPSRLPATIASLAPAQAQA